MFTRTKQRLAELTRPARAAHYAGAINNAWGLSSLYLLAIQLGVLAMTMYSFWTRTPPVSARTASVLGGASAAIFLTWAALAFVHDSHWWEDHALHFPSDTMQEAGDGRLFRYPTALSGREWYGGAFLHTFVLMSPVVTPVYLGIAAVGVSWVVSAATLSLEQYAILGFGSGLAFYHLQFAVFGWWWTEKAWFTVT